MTRLTFLAVALAIGAAIFDSMGWLGGSAQAGVARTAIEERVEEATKAIAPAKRPGDAKQGKVKGETDPVKTAAIPPKSAPKAPKKDDTVPEIVLEPIVARYAAEHGVPEDLVRAVIWVESRYKADIRGKHGEIGLMQIKPTTARGLGYRGSTEALFDPETNIRWGMVYLGKAHELANGDICGTILRYNAGHSAKRMNKRSAAYCRMVMEHMDG
ncbi:MAG: transglycosylase SLT domain-containing protein [Rhizobiaceae bacterium]|nr:transglycosylase SLT domain-containing protein [Rhizobiaceae bacterium]